MARGDVVSALASVANGSGIAYQPASGVETLVNSFVLTPNFAVSACHEIQVYDGAIVSVLRYFTDTAAIHRLSQRSVVGLKVWVTNTRYLRIDNYTGATGVLGFTGMQTK